MKLNSFCTTKHMVSKLKRPPTEWENIFANYTSDKRLISRVYSELKKLNSKKKNNDPIKKWATELNRTFSKEEVQMARNKPHQRSNEPS
jgi:DNA-binding transcriptional regulator GbsR (MarR family)